MSVGESGVPEATGENRALRFPTAGVVVIGGAGNILVCRVVRLCKLDETCISGADENELRLDGRAMRTTQKEGACWERERRFGAGRLSASWDMERIHYIIGFLACSRLFFHGYTAS